MVHDSSDTICAIATAPGVGGIAVVRISGLKALPVILRLFHHKGKQLSVEGVKPRHAYYGEVIADGELVSKRRTPLREKRLSKFHAMGLSISDEDC